jgi:aryl-alcohol dehydrogenase-like predicted oxidoreductase
MKPGLGLGTATLIANYGLGQAVGIRSPMELLHRAIQSGIKYVDTAPAYDDAEILLGELQPTLRSNSVRVCTKVDARNTDLSLIASVQSSLLRLQCDSVDTLLVHSATEEVLSRKQVIDALTDTKQAGRAENVGASTYGERSAEIAFRADWCDVIQIEFSILNQSVIKGIPSDRGEKEIVARSVLCKGLLTDRRKLLPDLPAAVARRIDELDRLADRWGFTLPELGIRFALDSPKIDIALVGLTNEEELTTALLALSRPQLSQKQIEMLSEFDCSSFDCVHPERWASS